MIMDEYLPGIQAILETDQSPRAAIQAIEDREVADDASGGAEGQGSGGAERVLYG